MKIYPIVVLCVVVLFNPCFAQKPKAVPPKKIGLIVAIGDYNRNGSGWPKISSENDIPLIKGALLKVGFLEGDVSILKDSAATRAGILKALGALNKRASKGDMVFIHVSSHGQQITDNNIPVEEADGYDEAIIAYGAPMRDSYYRKSRGADAPEAYDGRYHLRDEDFGAAINAIRAKIGKAGHILVTLDACHSGSGTRGSAIARGGEAPYDLQGTPPAPDLTLKQEDVGFGIDVSGKDGMGKFVLISGAQASEVNFETKDDDGKGVGSLSYCIGKALPAMEAKSSYRALFARITSEMADKAPKQTPQIEGDVDAEIFGNGFTPQARFIKVSKIIDARHLKIDGGKLANANVGTQVTVKSNLDGKVLAKGKVTEAANFDAMVQLEADLTERKPVNLQVHVTGYVVSGKKVLVNVDSVSNADLRNALTASLTQMGMVEISKQKSDLNVSDAASKGNFTVNINSTAYGSRLMNKPVSGTNLDDVVKSLTDLVQNYAQGNMFKNLDMRDESYKVVIRVIPFKADGKTIADTLDYKDGFLDKGNMLNFPEKTRILIEAKNLGSKKAYFNVVDLEPNGKINPIFPPINRKTGILDEQPDIFVLEPGQKKVFDCCPMTVNPPYGNEIFKVFATGIPFDLSSTINTKGAEVGTRGSNSPTPLEQLMGKSFEKVSTRGAETDEVNVEEMGTNSFEYVFRIVKKK